MTATSFNDKQLRKQEATRLSHRAAVLSEAAAIMRAEGEDHCSDVLKEWSHEYRTKSLRLTENNG